MSLRRWSAPSSKTNSKHVECRFADLSFDGKAYTGMSRACMIFLGVLLVSSNEISAQTFSLQEGDRVVFLGNSFFERALDYCHLETLLTLQWPECNISFRNLGWDGDTVYGHSRAGGRRRAVFGDAEEAFQRMIAHVRSVKPTVIFLAYGFNESFDGDEGIETFRDGLRRLVGELDSESTRFVFISPTPMEEGFGTKLGDSSRKYVSKRNAMLQKYSRVLAEQARIGKHAYIDLFNTLPQTGKPITNNGIHPTEEGYRQLAVIIGDELKLPPSQLHIDPEQSERVRAAIVRKNTLYFHRWRPRNDAFVYGERKSEQVIAQAEPEQFESFVAEQEQAIRQLVSTVGGAK